MPDRRKYDRNPDTLLVLSVGSAMLAIVVTAQSPPGSLSESWGSPWAMVWAISTGIGFLAAFIGVLLRDPLMGWASELGGRIVLTTGLGVYFAVLIGSIKETGTLVIAGLVFALAISSGWRVRQLWLRLREWERRAKDATS